MALDLLTLGGEGIVLKEPTSIYRSGIRSPAWLKVKPKVTLEIVVTGGSSEPIPWGDWGLAVIRDIAYKHPRDGKLVLIQQAVRIRRDEPFTLHAGKRAELSLLGHDAEWDAEASVVREVARVKRWSSGPSVRLTQSYSCRTIPSA